VRLTHQAVVWGLRAQGVEYLSVAVAWHTASTSILTRTWQTIAGDLDRLEGVHTLGVDVPAARFTIKREVPPLSGATPGEATATPAVVIDLTPVHNRTGSACLLDVVEGRSKKVLKTWLAQRDQAWRGRVALVAMDGFTGFKSAAGKGLPQGSGGS